MGRGRAESGGGMTWEPGRLGPARDTPQAMAGENIDLVRRNYEVINSIGRTGSEFVDPEDVAPDL